MQSGSSVLSGSWIYLVIAGMWAAVLVPMWLKQHDENRESKSADRFARAMGTLRRSRGDDSAPAPREVLMPGRSAKSRATEVVVTGPRAEQTPAAQAAARRRRTLFVLLGLLTVTLLLGALRVIPLVAAAAPLVLVLGFLVVARRQVAHAAEMRARRERRTALAEAARAADARYATGSTAARRGGRAMDPAPVSDRRGELVADTAYDAVAATGTDDAWHAVPTTLPTYVTAPRATKMPRVIDLTHPGAWTGAAMVEQARSSLAAEPVADGEMRVETFEITKPREGYSALPAEREQAAYSDRYVEDDDSFEHLGAQDDLDALLQDPRSGVDLPGDGYRRAVNG
ncbi:MAG: hypothetical protein AB7O74_07760 [Candidatus Nanopelagicales bacterium]